MLSRMSKAEISDARRQFAESGWLAGTPADFQARVFEHCIWQRVAPRVVLAHGGDLQGGLVGLVSGAVEIVSALGPSDTPIAHIARAPFWFGELPSIGGQARTATFITRTAADIALLPQAAVEAIMATRPEWWRLLGILSLEGIRLLTQISTDLLIHNTRRRCVAVLLRVAGCRTEGDVSCAAGIGQDELAAMANMSRQTAGTVLRSLEAEGAVTLGYRSITIDRPAQLRAIVDV